MADIPETTRIRPKLAVFHNLPVGGGANVAGALLQELKDFFSITVHSPFGSSSLNIPGSISRKEWPFRAGRRLSGIRKLSAPLSLPARLRSFDRLCRGVAEEINSTSDLALVHNSMFLAAPPILNYLRVPSVYFCYEFPRHLYEPELISRTENGLSRFLLTPLRSMEKKMDRKAALNADAMVTLSVWMKKRILDIYGIESSIVRPGIDTEFFQSHESSERKQFVLSVGAFWPFKGHEMAIKVVSMITPDIRPSLTIVGDREFPGYISRLERIANELGVNLSIKRSISNEELRLLYSTGKAVLCCQYNEPYGLVPLESMSCFIPVIAVKEGGFVDNIQSGENGILVKRDPSDMAEVLSMILTDQHLWERVTEGGRRFVTRIRTVSSAVQSLKEILSGIVTV